MPSDLLMTGAEDLIEVDIYYKARRNESGFRSHTILSEDEGKKAMEAEDEGVDVLSTKWSAQTWQLNNSIMKESTNYNKISGNQDVDWTAYQNKMIQYCLREWNVTLPDGTPVPPTVDNVGMMPANIVASLIKKYDASMKVDEEEKKE